MSKEQEKIWLSVCLERHRLELIKKLIEDGEEEKAKDALKAHLISDECINEILENARLGLGWWR